MKSPKRLELLTLALVSALAALPLFLDPGFLNTRGGGDSPFLLFRLHQLYSALAQGVFPVRWMPDAAFGLGYPFFNYYAALPLYLAALFKALGASYVLALKLTHLVGFVAAALGMHGWLRAAGASRLGAWLAAAAYTFAPFHLVNVFVRGDSLSEFWAFALYPICLWAARRLADGPSLSRGLLLALAYAALILTHNISALIFSPFLALYVVAAGPRPAAPDRRDRVRSLGHAAWALALGLSLAAFFWVPALGETGFGQLESQATGYFHYSNHFRGRDLVQPSPAFNYDVGSPQTTPFAMGLAQAAVVALGLIAAAAELSRAGLALLRGRRDGPPLAALLLYILFGLILSTFMITRYSEPLWARLPLLALVQFPWRFLSVQSLFASALIGLAIEPAVGAGHPAPGRPSPSLTLRLSSFGLLAALCILPSVVGLRLDFIPIADSDVTPEQIQIYEYFTGNIGTTIRHEYLPKWAVPRPYSSEEFVRRAVSLKVLGGSASGERLARRAASQTWQIAVDSESAAVAVPLLYWPGWEARADGQTLAVRPADGLGWIAFDLPRGRHRVDLTLGDTAARRAAGLISLGALVIAAVLLRPWRARPRWPPRSVFGAGGLMAAALVLSAVLGRWWNARGGPAGPATMDFDQLAYLNAAEVRFGNGDRLRNYEYSSQALKAGEWLAASFLWQGGGRATFDLALVSPAEHLLNLPRGIAETSGGSDGLVTVALRVPEDLPAGVYLPRLRLIEDGQNVPALTSGGKTRGAIYLRPVRVEAAAAGSIPLPAQPLGTLTPAVALLDVLAAQTDSAGVALTLNWRAAAPVPANYMLALRLRDPAGEELAALDVQPTGGIYPTSLWRAGEVIPDRYRLGLPLGLPPGDYPLTVTLYDAATLAPAGSAAVPVGLTKWAPPPGAAPLRRFTEALALHEVALPAAVRAGDRLAVSARWISLAVPAQDWRVRWSLVGPGGEVSAFADQDLAAVPSSQWAAGALVLGRGWVLVPIAARPGEYAVEGQLLDADGTVRSPPVSVGRVLVVASDRTTALPRMQFESGAAFETGPGAITLAGYDIALAPGTLTLRLHWRASGPAAANYKYFVHLFNPADETIAAQADAFPAVPTSQWFADEVVSETAALPLAALEPGTLYNIGVGWYDPETGGRLGERLILSQGVVKP